MKQHVHYLLSESADGPQRRSTGEPELISDSIVHSWNTSSGTIDRRRRRMRLKTGILYRFSCSTLLNTLLTDNAMWLWTTMLHNSARAARRCQRSRESNLPHILT